MLTLHVLSCGHGDTLLLQMPLGKWALIDCHLPSGEARDRFYRYTDNLKIATFDYVVLTHADSDHYRGMADVLERFSTHGRSVHFFCDSGANYKHVRLLQEACGLPEADMKEYAHLLKTVLKLSKSPPLQRQWLNDGTATIVIDGDTSGFALVVVSPNTTDLANSGDHALLGIAGGKPNINELSIVLIAQELASAGACRMFLPGDVEGNGLTGALARWDKHRENASSATTFDVIKVPHHGSKNGHNLALVNRIATKGSSIAAISSGMRVSCPARSVLTDYLTTGWRVHCTAPRNAQSATSSALQRTAVSRARSSGDHLTNFNIRIVVEPGKVVNATPAESEVVQSDVTAYA
jgi:beta-lactamase superfamily II metal-dependent hydrolase